MISHRVEGIIIDPLVEESKKNLNEIKKRKIPFVQASHYLNIDANWVGYDDISASYKVTNYVIKNNRNRLIFFGGYPGDSTYDDRIIGFKKALQENNLEFSKNNIINCEVEFEEVYKKTKNIIDQLNADAICAYNDLSALAIIKALREKDYKIPDDIAVTGIDNLFISELVNPGLTTVNLPKKQAGKEAVKMIVDEIENGINNTKKLSLSVDLIKRQSV